MGVLNLTCSKGNIIKLLENDIEIMDFLETTMSDGPPDDKNDLVVCSNLRFYHQSDGGAPEVEDFELVDATFNQDTRSGSVKLKYVVYFYFGCDDMNTFSEQDQTWNFEIDVANLILKLSVPERLERDTFEEY